MDYGIFFRIFNITLCLSGMLCFVNHDNVTLGFLIREPDSHYLKHMLPASQLRFARQRCLEEHPQADQLNYDDTPDTHCFVQCALYKMGLINLKTRGLEASKFLGHLDNSEEEDSEESCLLKFSFDEDLSGKCLGTYRKFLELRKYCFTYFERTFGQRYLENYENDAESKPIGQSASEFCTSSESDKEKVLSLLSQKKNRLVCLYKNVHYMDAYGRADESEILLSYHEGKAHNPKAAYIIMRCANRANTMFHPLNASDLALELHRCL